MGRVFALMALTGACLTGTAAAEPLRVEQFRCARAIVDRQPVQTVDCRAAERDDHLYLWVLLSGDGVALDALTQGRPIVLRQVWRRQSAAGTVDTVAVEHDLQGSGRSEAPERTNQTLLEERRLPAGRIAPDVAAKLRMEVAATGRFTWRTWSRKQGLSVSTYRITMVDDRRDPAACPETGGCVMTVMVVRLATTRFPLGVRT